MAYKISSVHLILVVLLSFSLLVSIFNNKHSLNRIWG
ncbi:hypothetical protein Goshw_027726 [Gossypium schwendimanii]|uniref:Uncharacterized protein n=1 Tax=Gossypium schwendimanii TaxID=34291 RepID=A0A7J9MKV9_GOSSC|nr:hypothetical protein [Gossypium schwendimanii]